MVETDPRKRVVITGLGAIGPLGLDVETQWARLTADDIGIGPIGDLHGELIRKRKTDGEEREYIQQIPGIHFAALVPDFTPPAYFPRKELKNISRPAMYSTMATVQALEDAGLMKVAGENLEFADEKMVDASEYNTGVFPGTGIGGAMWVAKAEDKIVKAGDVSRIMPSDMYQLLVDRVASVPSMRAKLQGPVKGSFSACASAGGALIDAWYRIYHGKAKVMVAGGAEGTLSEVAYGAFLAVHALAETTPDADPSRISIPFDNGAFGFVMGEGAGMMVLESLDHAQRRGAKIYAEFVNFSETADAYDDVAPSGEGAFNAMMGALVDAGIDPSEVDYINAHGTSTSIGDPVEADVIATLFGSHNERLAVSSTKGAHGHLLGGAAGLESVFTVLAIRDSIVPPTAGLVDPIRDDINFVPRVAQRRPVNVALKNAFAFGGMNDTLVFRRFVK